MSYTAEEKRQALLRVADTVEAIENYDHGIFGFLEIDNEGMACQTPSCSIGWYVYQNPAEPLRLKPGEADGSLLYPVLGDEDLDEPVEEYFSDLLDRKKIVHLFSQQQPGRTGPEQACLIREALQ